MFYNITRRVLSCGVGTPIYIYNNMSENRDIQTAARVLVDAYTYYNLREYNKRYIIPTCVREENGDA